MSTLCCPAYNTHVGHHVVWDVTNCQSRHASLRACVESTSRVGRLAAQVCDVAMAPSPDATQTAAKPPMQDTTLCAFVQAIALGADAVMVGRPILYGLALQGEDGVRHVLQMLRRELCLAMQLAGCTSLKAITPSLVIPFGQNAFVTSSKL